METKLKQAGKTLVVRLEGELDHHAADNLREQIDTKLTRDGFLNVLFNFAGVRFMDSSGLGMVLGRFRLVSERGGKVLACSLNSRVRRVFDLSGLERLIPVYQSEQDALKHV